MSRLVARIKILPADSETDIDKLINNLKTKGSQKRVIRIDVNQSLGEFKDFFF